MSNSSVLIQTLLFIILSRNVHQAYFPAKPKSFIFCCITCSPFVYGLSVFSILSLSYKHSRLHRPNFHRGIIKLSSYLKSESKEGKTRRPNSRNESRMVDVRRVNHTLLLWLHTSSNATNKLFRC